jgi:hypothetical protein
MEGVVKEITETPIRAADRASLASLNSWLKRMYPSFPAGEMHRLMYNEVSLSRLIKSCGFEIVKVVDPETSRIPKWRSYYLDTSPDGSIHEPGSIYI